MNGILVTVCVIVAIAGYSFFMSCGRVKKVAKDSKTNVTAKGSYNVNIPEESFVVAELNMDGKPFVGVFNSSVLDVEPKIVFRWFLSLVVIFDDTVGDDMPNNDDTVKMQDFYELLDKNIKCDENHPNAIFVGRFTGDGQTQMMWYVNNPELVDKYLQDLISSKEYPYEFNYEMYADDEWKEGHYWLDPLLKKK